jgi:hypothetical protein
VRRCRRCRKIDDRQSWDNPVGAHADATLDDRPAWYRRRKRRWVCPYCGFEGYEVDQQRPD